MKKLLRFFSARPFLKRLAYSGAAFFGAFALSDLQLGRCFLPAAPALIAALPFGLPCTAAFLGTVSGIWLFWGISGGLTPIAAAFLLFVERLLFRDLPQSEHKWFLPASAAALFALCEGLSVLEAHLAPMRTLLYFVQIGFLLLCCYVFSNARQRAYRRSRYFAGLCLLAALCRIRPMDAVSLGVIFATFTAASALTGAMAFPAAAACGLTLVLCGEGAQLGCGFCMAAFLCTALPWEYKLLHAAAELFCTLAFVIFAPEVEPSAAVGAVMGCILFAVFPRGILFAEDVAIKPAQQSALERSAELLSSVGRIMQRTLNVDRSVQSAAVFDGAAEAVCRGCANWNNCWERNASQTYDALSGAAAHIFARGKAEKTDFPPQFLENCIRSEQFLHAVDEAVQQRRIQRQYQRKLTQIRAASAEQYGCLSAFLRSIAEPQPMLYELPTYTAEVGYRTCGIRSDQICGDSGRSFTCGEWFYLILCDGMGTGGGAQNESRAAVKILSELIISGMDAENALKMLGAAYTLRADGSFSTVDLLQLSMVSGEGFLHKWGAAPSYLQSASGLRQLGKPTPPPLVGKAACIRLSMKHGQTLILTSDGVEKDVLKKVVQQGRRMTPTELAAAIVDASGENDDRTAAVLRLHSLKAAAAIL